MVDNELAKELLGLDLSQVNFKKTDNKNLSFEALFGVSQEAPTKYDEFLKERGFIDVLKNASYEFKIDYAKTLMSAEAELGTQITIETVEDSNITGLIRSQESKGNLIELFNYIQEQNDKITSDVVIKTNIPIKPLTFNRIIEGKYSITHVAFDTEADKEGHTILNTAVNYEAKRIVVGYLSEKYELYYFKTVEGWDLYYLGTPNLWESCLTADYEALIAANITSALEQGSIETLSLYQKLFSSKIPNSGIKINLELLAEYLNNQRKGVWIPHNNFYDINQLNALYKHKKGKRRKFNVVKTKELEYIKIRFQQEDLYTIKLGNTFVGWRFNAQSNTRYSFFGLPQITVAPSQTMSFSFVNGVDTLNLAYAGRFKSKKLEDLSEGLTYEKTKIKEEKIFSKADLEFTSDFQITNKLHYNIMDCCATLAVYSMLSYHFNLDEIGKILEIDLSVTKNWHKPFISSIVSPATISKFVFDIYLQSITGLSKHEIEANLELSRQYLLNFKKTYLGGRNEGFIFGTVENTVDKLIKYLDFESQYPNASRLIQAELQLKLAAKGSLHEYLCYDKETAVKDFWETVELCINCKKKGIPLPDSFAEKIYGNITFTYSKIKNLMIRARLNKRLQDIYINSDKKDKTHKITLTMFDLLAIILICSLR